MRDVVEKTMMRMLMTGLIVSVLSQAVSGAGERMTPERLWQLKRLGGACINAEGSLVAYASRSYDLEKNSGTSEIHLVDLANDRDWIVVRNLKSVSSLQLVDMEDAPTLFYVGLPASDGDEKSTEQEEAKAQVWSVDIAGAAPRQVTNVKAGVANLKVSPGGTHIAFTSDVKMDSTVNEMYEDLPKADARIIDSLMYRHWNAWHDYAFSHLHVARLTAEGQADEIVDLMQGLRADCPLPPFGGAEQYNWSPDGSEIAYTAKVVNDPAESTDSDIYVVATDGSAAATCITPGMDGFDTDPVYSPDGRWLAFHSMRRAGFEADKNRVMLFDRASRQMRDLTADLDQTAHGVTWMPDSQSVLFMSEYRGANQLFQMRIDDTSARQVTRGDFNWSLIAVLPPGDQLLVNSQSMLRPKELSLLQLDDGSERRLSHLNDRMLSELELPKIEQRWVPASDGKMIHCWVIYPPDFDATGNWPLITYCQGGPQGQIGQWFSFRWNFHLMAASGYVIVAPNRRGLPGFGREWNDQISGDWGGQAMQDILAATDAMMLEPYIDTERMAAVGASFGGYTTYWLMGNHRDRFRCMVAHCGVFNLESMYGATEEIWFPNWDLGGPYWQDEKTRRAYDRFSPHRFVGNWRTPLLVVHGEKDFRVPVTQGMEAFTAAQLSGVPSRFLYFPAEGHWVLGPQNGVLWHRVFFDWLDRYCK
jgi:dipeptidyl aminopeptidase/acylaminoacyl peptidase